MPINDGLSALLAPIEEQNSRIIAAFRHQDEAAIMGEVLKMRKAAQTCIDWAYEHKIEFPKGKTPRRRKRQ